ncbi:P-loop containing nucleoside triphosphate hydrolase protein [Dentipellis sp. KUC8613]|nr:P-loop containing nucleoside triphosphate hydrolase protein [Dentipellis sp. KUC8613]
MQFDPTKHTPVGLPSLKRPHATGSPATPPVKTTDSLLDRISDVASQPPAKMMKLDQAESSRASGASSRSGSHRAPRGGPTRSSGKSRGSKNSKGHSGGSASVLALPQVDDPIHDLSFITKTYKSKDLKKAWEENPKSPLSNFLSAWKGTQPTYQLQPITLNGKSGWRAVIQVNDDPVVIGVGDGQGKKDAEQLAALSAIYQLNGLGLLDNPQRLKNSGPSTPAVVAPPVLSDGTTITYESARQFMDYYCRRYGFGSPDVTYNEIKGIRGRNNSWEAVMNVDGRRIGIGLGANKKIAQTNCYIDVTQYLESCDQDLWKAFQKATAEGRSLGMAPKVLFQMSDLLEDDIRDLCGDVRKSRLYQNRPAMASASANATVANVPPVPRYRRPVPLDHLAAKSQRLLQQRQKYEEDPLTETMRKTRKALPVYTRAEDMLSHVRDNEVTICMAATGSGKTTQIPQLILDEYIQRGEGAKCNIVCTQPRRLAAISVATRVSQERNEVLGKGSVGYHVRFDSKLPEEYGCITFCTTGIFLRRMQSALLEGGSSSSMSLDDVTHVIVDEVHERDVDTDLLLVVLKRLLADRRAKGKPLKVILMSATIDPTLFQQYFVDDQGNEAPVVEIPGRSFPVTKHFLEDFVQPLSADPATRWVFAERSVSRFLQQELGQAASGLLDGRFVARPGANESEDLKDEDLELPSPLIALTIAHVLRTSDDGHVLVFLPGWEEIMAVNRILLERPLGVRFNDPSKFSIHLLHSSIPVAEQQVIFDPPPKGVRRIILATNIAETSITIPDVVYVVDTGKVKEQRYDPQRHMSSLVSAWVGSSNLNQRAGRAGRHRSGEYYGILGQRRANELNPYQTVEMKRVDLTNVVMHVKALDFPGMAVEEVLASAIEPPAAERVVVAMKDLQMVGAIDEHQNLTALGRVLLQLPIEVQVGRLVLFGCFFRCLDQALTLAALMTNRDPFVSPMHLKIEASAVKNSWTVQEFRSDTLAALRAYNAWWEMQGRGEYVSANRFCSENFLSKPTLLTVEKIKRHILASLYHTGILDVSAGGKAEVFGRGRDLAVPPQLNDNGDSLPLLAALIAVASQPNFAIRTGEKTYRTQQDKTTFIHPSSVNHRKRELSVESLASGVVDKQIIAFSEKRQNISMGGSSANAQMSLVTTTRLDPMTYVLFGAYRIEVTERGLECDNWLPIVGNIYALDDIQRLKTMMEGCMMRVYEGILMNKRRHPRLSMPIAPREEEESGDEDDTSTRDYSLSATEVKELDLLTRDIVRILNRYADERVATQSRSNSRPATPMGSPSHGSVRLPQFGSRSGQTTPHGMRSAYNSRPSTPSRLSRLPY